MLLARVCRGTLVPQAKTLFKVPTLSKPQVTKFQTVRLLANDGRSALNRSARRATIAERAAAPAGEAAFKIGKGAVAGGAAIGIGALCFYGLGLSSQAGAIDRVGFWPEYVKDRIRATYIYFGATVVASGVATALCLRSPAFMNLLMQSGWKSLVITIGLMMGSGAVVRSIPYQEGFGAKQIAWLVHAGILGAVLAPVCTLGGALIMRAAWYTAGIVGGLSAIAVCAPNEKFLNYGGPLAMGFGVVFCSSIGANFLPPTSVLGAGLHSIAIYGGLLLFSALLLYDTQRVIKHAETAPHNYNTMAPFDPINHAVSIYLDAVNIFIRIVYMLASGGNKRK